MRSSERASSGSAASRGGGLEGSGPLASCQDCGNKAKRDCGYMRCRTCCKSRGFDCPTHIKSTWVPIARRRQILHQRLSLSSATSDVSPGGSGGGNFPLFHRQLQITSPRQSSSSGLQAAGTSHNNFPAEVTSLANFRCVRVSSEDNAVDQVAYQTSINISGRLFKGILYDQGSDHNRAAAAATVEGSSMNDPFHHLHHHQQQLHSGGTSTAAAIVATSTSNFIGIASSSTSSAATGVNLLYPTRHHQMQFPFYASPPAAAPPPPPAYTTTTAFMPGMQFFPHPPRPS